MASASTFVWEKAIALMSEISFLPYMSLVPFELLLQHWNSQGRYQVSLCIGPLRGTAWDSKSILSHSSTTSDHFYRQKLKGLLFLALKPWARGPGIGMEALVPRYPCPFLFNPCGCGTNPFHGSTPPISLHVSSSLYLSCRTPVQLNFWWF